ncbi:MAG: SDR family NAD(P)-dependent oxidoreductase [Defluviimonas sp.]|uniref:aminotransferase class I/II-fold pyridoxal phosphate-dependent enzyme n=1 Tax=Albidovulum sp. TaxID=1872424 RepID=UPI002A27A0BD|nr:SDR family NAD(P)-dependent oxidoreductase [Defluviimonas sp.]
MRQLIHRSRQLSAKVVRRLRRVAANLSEPSDIEKLLAAMPRSGAVGEVAGSRILITGSTRGVGRVMAETLARDGALVIVHGRDPGKAAAAAAAIAGSAGGRVASVAGDLSDPDTDLVAQAAAEVGGIDVLIHNAGVLGPSDTHIWDVPADTLSETMRTNFDAVHRLTSSLVKHWLAAQTAGRILFISTGTAEIPTAKLGPYGIAKSAMERLARSYAHELGTSGIALATIRLGSVRTDMTRSYFNWEDAEQLPPPETVMPVIQYALTADSRAVHGRVLTSWGVNADPLAGRSMAHPAAGMPAFHYPKFTLNGQPVARDSDKITVFDRAENQFGPAPQVTQALSEMLHTRPLSIYPDDDYDELRSVLARTHGLKPENFTIGAGSWDVLDRILKLYALAGDSVVVNDPGWFGFTMLTQRRQVRQIAVPFDPGRSGNRPHHDLERVLQSIDYDTRLIYLINPSNPEGVPLDRAEFLAFLDRVPAHIPVIVDEAYAEFSTAPGRLIGADIVNGTEKPVIVTRTFSKFYGLAAMRIGYGIARPEIVERLDRMALIFTVSKMAETAAIAALGAAGRNDTLRNTIAAERDRIFNAVQETGRQPIHSDSCMMLVPPPVDPVKFWDTYEAQNIHMPRAAFFGGDYVLMPVARPDQNTRNIEIYRSFR